MEHFKSFANNITNDPESIDFKNALQDLLDQGLFIMLPDTTDTNLLETYQNALLTLLQYSNDESKTKKLLRALIVTFFNDVNNLIYKTILEKFLTKENIDLLHWQQVKLDGYSAITLTVAKANLEALNFLIHHLKNTLKVDNFEKFATQEDGNAYHTTINSIGYYLCKEKTVTDIIDIFNLLNNNLESLSCKLNRDGYNFIHLLLLEEELSCENKNELLKYFIENNQEACQQVDSKGNNILHIAIEHDLLEEARLIIENFPSLIKQENHKQLMPLAYINSENMWNILNLKLTLDSEFKFTQVEFDQQMSILYEMQNFSKQLEEETIKQFSWIQELDYSKLEEEYAKIDKLCNYNSDSIKFIAKEFSSMDELYSYQTDKFCLSTKSEPLTLYEIDWQHLPEILTNDYETHLWSKEALTELPKNSDNPEIESNQLAIEDLELNYTEILQKLGINDRRQYDDYNFLVHSFKTGTHEVNYLAESLAKNPASFFQYCPFVSASIVSKSTPRAEMNHQRNSLPTMSLILNNPSRNILFMAPHDCFSGSEHKQSPQEFLEQIIEYRQKVKKSLIFIEFIKDECHKRNIDENIFKRYLQLIIQHYAPAAYQQSYTSFDGKPFPCTPNLEPFELAQLTDHGYYNEVLVIGKNLVKNSELSISGILIEHSSLKEFIGYLKANKHSEDALRLINNFNQVIQLGLQIVLIKTDIIKKLNSLPIFSPDTQRISDKLERKIKLLFYYNQQRKIAASEYLENKISKNERRLEFLPSILKGYEERRKQISVKSQDEQNIIARQAHKLH